MIPLSTPSRIFKYALLRLVESTSKQSIPAKFWVTRWCDGEKDLDMRHRTSCGAHIFVCLFFSGYFFSASWLASRKSSSPEKRKKKLWKNISSPRKSKSIKREAIRCEVISPVMHMMLVNTCCWWRRLSVLLFRAHKTRKKNSKSQNIACREMGSKKRHT